MSHDAVLEHVRKLVNGLLDAAQQQTGINASPTAQQPQQRIGSPPPPLNGESMTDKMGSDWCFIDCKCSTNFFLLFKRI